MDNVFTVDIHTHILPENIPNFKEKFGYGGFIRLDHHKPCCAKMMMDDKEIEEAMSVKGIFDELYYTEDQTELISINSIDGKDVYKVKITQNEITSYRYYAVESGLLVSVEEEDEKF